MMVQHNNRIGLEPEFDSTAQTPTL